MATDLIFEKNNKNIWETTIQSNGETMVVELIRAEKGTLIIYGNIDGLDKIILSNLGPGADKNILFELDFPLGVIITIESYTEVLFAKCV